MVGVALPQKKKAGKRSPARHACFIFPALRYFDTGLPIGDSNKV
jgi:hypothetical protein